MQRFYFFLVISAVFVLGCSGAQFDLPAQQVLLDAEVQYNNKVDLLFMIDNSTTMNVHQAKLVQQVPSLIQELNRSELDYRLAVVTADMRSQGSGGRLLGTPSFLTRQHSGLVELFQQRLQQGQNGSDIEAGLESLYQALIKPEGQNFLRREALLAMVILTNEDDYSPKNPDFYRQAFDELKGSVPGYTRGWMMNFLGVVDLNGTCQTAPGFKEVGLRYLRLVEATEGVAASICDQSLAFGVSNIRKRIVQVLSDYPLAQEPNLSTVQVWLNGELVPMSDQDGWTYVSATRRIRFHGRYLPKPSDRIRVDYKPAGGA